MNQRWPNSKWQYSRWLPSFSLVRNNEFESDWISLSQSFVQNGWIQDGRIQDGCHHQFEWEYMSEVFLCKWLNPRWQHSRWLPSSSSVRMNEFESDWIRLSQSFVQNGWIQDGRIQDGCHHLVNKFALVWVKVRVEGECFWVNLREDNKVPESKMAVSESNLAEFRVAAIIKLSQNEWVKVFLCKEWEPILASVSEFEREN